MRLTPKLKRIQKAISEEKSASAPESYESSIHTWGEGRLSARPGYYSGRGPNPGDLGRKHLEMLHAGMLKDFGKTAAYQFCLFVASLKDMSATAFLVAYQRFFQSGFLEIPKQAKGDGNTLSGRGDELTGEAFGCLMGAMFERRTPEQMDSQSESIKNDFLRGVQPDLVKMTPGRVNLFGYGGW